MKLVRQNFTDDGSADHYHVFAVQGWGHGSEYWQGWADRLDLAAARQFVEDVIRADDLMWRAQGSPQSKRDREQGDREFGDRFCDLASTNVRPGWEAIWIVPDGADCRYVEMHTMTHADIVSAVSTGHRFL